MKYMILKKEISIMLVLMLAFSYLAFSMKEKQTGSERFISKKYLSDSSFLQYPLQSTYSKYLDTIFVLGNSFVEISLKDQTATLHTRGDTTRIFNISSGTDKVSKGIKTRQGLFTVQSKLRIAKSRQFNNAKLYHWVGYNYNIGFHGLRSKGYYQYLGKKPSSHGCVRIAREDGKILYRNVKVGTPVMVYEEQPARMMAFIDSIDIVNNHTIFLIKRGKYQKRMLDQRIKDIYSGDIERIKQFQLVLDGRTVLRPGGYSLGELSKVPYSMRSRKLDVPIARIDNVKIHGLELMLLDSIRQAVNLSSN